MRTAFSSFLALIVTLVLLAILATTLEPGPYSKPALPAAPSDQPPSNPSSRSSLDELIDKIEAARSCSVDADCTIQTFGCPIDCYSPVSTDKVEMLAYEFESLRLSESWSCAYWCVGVPEQARVACIDGQCQMSIGGLPDELTQAVETVPLLLLDQRHNGQYVRVYGYLRRNEQLLILYPSREACVEIDTKRSWLEIRAYLQPPENYRRLPCSRTMVIGRYEAGPFLTWGAGTAVGRIQEVTYFRVAPLPID
jgi:hypothetical protein